MDILTKVDKSLDSLKKEQGIYLVSYPFFAALIKTLGSNTVYSNLINDEFPDMEIRSVVLDDDLYVIPDRRL